MDSEELALLRHKIGERARSEDDQWEHSDELDPRWPPSAGVRKRLYRKGEPSDTSVVLVEDQGKESGNGHIQGNGHPSKPMLSHYCYRCQDLGIPDARWEWDGRIHNWLCTNYSQHDRHDVKKDDEVPASSMPVKKREGTTVSAVPSLKRSYRPYKERSVAWYDPKKGELLHEEGNSHRVAADSPLLAILPYVTSRVLYILPDASGHYPDRAWYEGPVRGGYQLSKYLAKNKAATLKRDDITLDIYPVAQFFDIAPSVAVCREAYRQLTALLIETFKSEHARLLGTASVTGTNLLMLTLPKEKEYPILPEEIRGTIIGNFGQGRVETFPPCQETIDHLYELDGIWMYAACIRDVPTGPYTHDTLSAFAGYTPAIYHIVARVPGGWCHIGLLPSYDKIAARNGRDVHTIYPNRPGDTFETWASHHELRLAYEQGWEVTITERILWTERSSDPLRVWGDKLKALRERASNLEEPYRTMLRGAIRSLMLKAIGSFHRHEVKQDGYMPRSEWKEGSYPDDIDTWEGEGDTIHYTISPTLTSQQLQRLHPEWTAYIWGLARAKLARAALELPYDSIVALRTDGVWTTCDVATYPTNLDLTSGKPGSWRVKYSVNGPIPWPVNNAAMGALIQEIKDRSIRNG